MQNYKVGCSCEGQHCSPESCDHVDIFDNDNLDALDIYGQPMKGRFPYDDKGCIILEVSFKLRKSPLLRMILEVVYEDILCFEAL